MNEIRTSCAPTDQTISSWESIDWTKCELEVRKLQARIVKAQNCLLYTSDAADEL